jgi:hypothetical protein
MARERPYESYPASTAAPCGLIAVIFSKTLSAIAPDGVQVPQGVILSHLDVQANPPADSSL